MPKRIQRKRTKGWRMPGGAVYVGRPTKWGNPYTVFDISKRGGGREYKAIHRKQKVPGWGGYTDSYDSALKKCLEWYRSWVLRSNDLDFNELRGKDLACWCPLDQPCHADVLLELANE